MNSLRQHILSIKYRQYLPVLLFVTPVSSYTHVFQYLCVKEFFNNDDDDDTCHNNDHDDDTHYNNNNHDTHHNNNADIIYKYIIQGKYVRMWENNCPQSIR